MFESICCSICILMDALTSYNLHIYIKDEADRMLGKQKLIVHNGHRPPFELWALDSDCETKIWMHTHVAVDWVELYIWYGFALYKQMLTNTNPPPSLSFWICLWPLFGGDKFSKTNIGGICMALLGALMFSITSARGSAVKVGWFVCSERFLIQHKLNPLDARSKEVLVYLTLQFMPVILL